MILGFWFFLYTYLMILFKDILDLLQPRQRLPPSLQKLIYDHNSAINDHGLQNIFVHFSYEIIPRYFELITTASAVAALTSKNGSMIIAWQQMILGFWNFVYTSLRKIPKYFGLITTAPAVAASPFKNWCMIITRQLMILGFWIFLYNCLMKLFRDILELITTALAVAASSYINLFRITYIQKASILYQFKSLRQTKARPSITIFKSIYIWNNVAPLAFELGDGRAIGG